MANVVHDQFQPIQFNTELVAYTTASATTSRTLPVCGAVQIASGGGPLFFSFIGSATNGAPGLGTMMLPANTVDIFETQGNHKISFKVDDATAPATVSITPMVGEPRARDVNEAAFQLDFPDLGGGVVDMLPTFGKVFPTFTRATTATTVLSSGLIGSVASGSPRSYYDPTSLVYLGYLAEGQRQNLCLQSEVLTTTWTLVGAGTTFSSNAFTAPDGALTGDKIIPANGTSGGINQALVLTAGSAWTISAWAKSSSLTVFQIYADDGVVTSSAQVTYNASTGAVISAAAVVGNWTAASSTAKQYPNGWWRFTLTFTTTTDAGSRIRLVVNETGDGVSGIVAWGAQVENAAFASTYIPTTTVAVTRNADVLTYPLTLPASYTWFIGGGASSALAGTFPNGVSTTGDTALVLLDGTSRRLGANAGGATFNALYSANTYAAGAPFKSAFAAATNDAAGCEGGAAVTTDATFTPTTGAITLTVGATLWFGTISSVRLFNSRLANATLQSLTS